MAYADRLQLFQAFNPPTEHRPLPHKGGARPNLTIKVIDERLSPSKRSHGTVATPKSILTPPLTPQTLFDSRPSSIAAEPGQFPNFLRAFYQYHPDGPISDDDQVSITLPINEGDVILVHSIQPNGWADGTLLRDGARGWLPTNYCEVYEPMLMRPLLTALTNVWEFMRGHEDDGWSGLLSSQDYVRSMIAGVRRLLQQSGCLSRESEPVARQQGIRLLRKALLSDLSGFAKKAKAAQGQCQNGPFDRDILYGVLDEVLLKAFKVVSRAVRFLDLWHQAWHLKQDARRGETDLPVMLTAVPSLAGRDSCSQPHEISFVGPAQSENFQNALHPFTAPADGPSPVSLGDSPLSIQNDDLRSEDVAHDSRDVSRTTQLETAEPSASVQIPSTPPSFTKRSSTSHRLSRAAPSPTSPDHVLASVQLAASHEAFLGLIGSFIGLHLHSRPLMELLNTTKQSITACDALLHVVEEIWEQDFKRSDAVDAARAVMHVRLAELVNATREIFLMSQANGDEDVRLPEQTHRLVDAATACVRSAGDCVSKSRAVVERSGDFEIRRQNVCSTTVLPTGSQSTLQEEQQLDTTPRKNGSADAKASPKSSPSTTNKPLPATPPSQTRSVSRGDVPRRTASRPPMQRSPSAQSSQLDVTMQLPTVSALRVKSHLQLLERPSSLSRRSSETGLRKAGSRPTRTTGSGSQFPTLQLDIPQGSFFDTSITPTRPASASAEEVGLEQPDVSAAGKSADGGQATHPSDAQPNGANSADGSVTDSFESKSDGTRSSGDSATSHVSTRATTPDNAERSMNPPEALSQPTSESSGEHGSGSREARSELLTETFAHELTFNREGQVTGGSLPALVERLTAHDTTPDALFVRTFYLTFRLFTTPVELAQTLVDRFERAGDDHEFGTPIRLRVYNILKGWMEGHWDVAADVDALSIILGFANGRLRFDLPSASRRLLELSLQISDKHSRPNSPKSVQAALSRPRAPSGVHPSPEATAPTPNISKGQLNMLKTLKNGVSPCTILDLDPLELARQLTIMQSKIFCAIQPEELLALEWTKKQGSKAVNVLAMSALSTDLTNLVADTILQLEIKRRAGMIKRWVKIASRCLDLGNYDALMAIVCSLNSSVVQRLKKTWDYVSPKAVERLAYLNTIIDHAHNRTVLRQRLQGHVPPCLPFVGLYLTDLTFVDAGNQPTRQLPGGGESQTVINFDKYIRVARIIGDLQRFQVPYKLTPIPEVQDWMESQIARVRDVDENNVQNYYRRSLMLEPREIPASKAAPIDSATSSFGSQQSKESGHGNKFEFLTGLSLSLSKEKASS